MSGLIYLTDVVCLHIRYLGACSYQLHHRVIWPLGGAQDYQGLAKGSNQIMATAKQVYDVKQIQPITSKTDIKD